MHNALIEHKWIDLGKAPPVACTITDLTGHDERLWAGIVDIGKSGFYTFDDGSRYDVYVLSGDVELDGRHVTAGDFSIQCGPARVQAGVSGARLFVYRETSAPGCEPVWHTAAQRVWRPGRNPKMRVSTLSSHRHRVSLVEWQPGAHTIDHGHSNGEEIFVLDGELRDADHRYPAGTWLRLHPGARHEPFADEPTVILLRNGHLQAEPNEA